MKTVDLDAVKERVVEILRESASSLRREFQEKEYERRLKGVSDYQTSADTGLEIEISGRLAALYPEWGFSGEEGTEKAGTGEYRWLLDPICSSNNFVFGLPLFGTSLGLLRGEEVVLAVIYLPVLNRIIGAVKGKGSSLDGRPARVSRRDSLGEALLLYDNQFYRSERMLPNLVKLSSKCFTMRITGSAAYDMFLVAAGRADARIFHHTKIYDFLPASLLVEESGGKVTDFQGEPVGPGTTAVVASNGLIHEELLAELGEGRD